MTEVERTLKAQRAGAAAYNEGQHPRDCPHRGDQAATRSLRRAWVRGYAMARTERARRQQLAGS